MAKKIPVNNQDCCEVFCFDEAKVEYIKEEVQLTQGLSQIFKALSDDTRLKIIYALSKEELCVCDVSQIINSSMATASHHLRVLRNMGLAKSRKQGKMVFYTLIDECIENILNIALNHYSQDHAHHGLREIIQHPKKEG